MEGLIIGLIFLQSFLMIIGYGVLARQIADVRKRIETLGGLAFAIPLLTYGVKIGATFPNMQIGQLEDFLTFFFASLIANVIIGTVIEAIEHTLFGGRR